MTRRKKRRVRKTLLAVGEGHTEIAFLKYLRSIYCTGSSKNAEGPKVNVKNARGKGPKHVLDTALAHQKQAQYDQTIILLDTDIPWDTDFEQTAKRNGITIIGSTPCIEAVFLCLIDQAIPSTTEQCKREIKKYLKHDLTKLEHYKSWCTKEKLEKTNNNTLRLLIQQYK